MAQPRWTDEIWPRLPPPVVALIAYAGAAALGLYFCRLTFPAALIFPAAPPDGFPLLDAAQHIAGQRYFIADDWRWPLLTAANLGTPDGTNIAFVDAIPIFAIILKSIRGLLPEGFHGILLWYAISLALQPVAAVWCLRAAGEKRLVPAICIAVISLCIPAWWNRFGHAALTGHFLLLLAVGGYFHLSRHGTALRWLAALLLNVVALLVHPYLFFMTSAILLAVPVTALVRRDGTWWTQGLYAGAFAASSLLVAKVLGYTGAQGGGHFGAYAMNLLSPFWPSWSSLLRFDLPRVETTPGSEWEGYNYLGIGILFLLLTVVVLRARSLGEPLRRHAGLLLVALGLGVLSLSNNIGIGSLVFMDVYPTNAILDNFRSSARMFWAVTYILLVALVLGALHLRPKWLGLSLVVVAALLQLRDTVEMRMGLMWYLEGHAFVEWPVDAANLRRVFADSRELTLIPGFACGMSEEEKVRAVATILIASETALPVNTMYVARWQRPPSCADEQFARAPFRDGEARVLLPSASDGLREAIPDRDAHCRAYGELLVCAADRQNLPQAGAGPAGVEQGVEIGQ
ncbi:DUF6311 domain-containing protein [Pseudochelatococcus sp. B33]